jgi:sulfotransferase family protein
MKPAFLYHSLRRDISNFSLIKHRAFDGFLISMHQSGTHWLKHMLATALTHKYELPPPQYIHANDVIAGPKDPLSNVLLPHIVSTHSIPHILLGSSLFRRLVKLPPYVILVRDIRASLVSNFEKWKEHYACDFETYLHGDISGRRFNNDIWWCLRFCNKWGELAKKFPDGTLIVKYEDLKSSPLQELQRINSFWQLDLTEDLLSYAISESSKEKMALKKDPDTPFGVTVVRKNKQPFMEWYDNDQSNYFSNVCDEFLNFDFGYDYRT